MKAAEAVVMPFRILSIWLVILVLAVLNGMLRENLLVPQFGTLVGQLVSGLLLCALILLVTRAALPWLGPQRPAALVAVGLVWLVLTLVFEFSLGLAQGQSWPEMLAAYRFHDGNLWPLVLLVTALAPWAMDRLRGR